MVAATSPKPSPAPANSSLSSTSGLSLTPPQTNGKAERFIQTALREWAYATAFEHSEQRYAALPAWLHRYNWHRPHVSLARKPPISRLGLTGDNLLRLHS